ncbi:hypothetical protein Cni_G11028 [Canna indica]|uniref:GIR1-like zinc ribbon domain-containing protein n=1 Tax=Canna indica TaxID=4628 RepID=A0AAQ3Q947_9LILI|nr:hypothetical protein Cni_G11028 [Canna indica]
MDCLRTTMSQHRRNHPNIDLKLILAPPIRVEDDSLDRPLSSPRSCLSSETEQAQFHDSSEEAAMMVLAACPRCLMYLMLAKEDPKCPKCKNSVLLNFLHGKRDKKT